LPVTEELNAETPTFENVARLISENEDDVAWLAEGLLRWVWPQERYPPGARKFGRGLGMFADMRHVRWSRAKLHKALSTTLPNAAETVSDLLSDFALFQLLTEERLGPGFGPLERVTLGNLLHEIRRRCAEASQSPELVSRNGKPKAGRNKALAPGQIEEKVACASAIVIAWTFARGKAPGPQVKRAALAAELLFELGMAPAGRFDLIEGRRGWGKDRLNAWPPYFREALHPSPMLIRLNGMLLEMLKAAHTLRAAERSTLAE
jgi:hypothetical protein